MNCPGCDAEMTDLEENDERVRVCQECGGLWIDVADLNRLLLHHNLPGLDSLGGKVDPTAAVPVCRDCMLDLTRIEKKDRQESRYYETCESCGGIFIEGNPDEEPAKDLRTAQKQIVAAFERFAGKKKG